jgi:hypothetical protein
MRRWFFRIVIGFAVLIAVVIAVVQIVLWSPLPKRIVLQQIEKELGLRITADSLSTGWLGKSELTNVSLGLPLSSQDFLKVKTLKIQHSSLIGLALGQVVVKSIEIEDPLVEVVQDGQGQWNLQQVIELLGRVGGGTSASEQTPDTGIPQLPIVRLSDGSVQITDNQKHTASLQPLTIVGQPDGALVWRYDLTIASSIALTGKVAPGGIWQHQISLTVHDLDPLVKNWGVPSTYAATVKSHWTGQIANGKLTGTLALDQATAAALPVLGDVQFAGSVNAEINGPLVTLHPNEVDLKTSNLTLPDLTVQAGSIVSDASGLHAQAVKVKAFGGQANLDGNFNLQTQAADLKASWSGLSLAKKTSQTGSLTASLRQPFAGQPVIVVNLDDVGTVGGIATTATAPPGRYEAKLNLTGQGSSWKTIDWLLTAPKLVYSTPTQSVDLSQLSAHVSQHLPVIELSSLSLPANSAAGTSPLNFTSMGRVDFDAQKWNFDATGGFNTFFQSTPVPVTVALHTLGTNTRFDLQSLTLGIADVTLTASGSYDSSLPTPVGLHILLAQTPRIAPDAPVQGEVSGDFKIVGDLFKGEHGRRFRPYLTTTGDLRSSDLVLFNRPIGDIDVKLQGDTSTPNLPGGEPGPCVTRIQTVDFKLFQAPWDLTVNFPNADGTVDASLETRKLAMEELAKFAKVDGISGLLNAKWVAVIPSAGLSGIDLYSEYHLSNLLAKGMTIDSVDATATLNKGILRLNPLLAKSGNGSITATASMDLQHPASLATQLTVDHWPYQLSQEVAAQVSASGNATLDLSSKDLGASGSLSAAADLMLDGRTKLGHSELSATVLHRAISIDRLDGNILTGKFNGVANLDLDKPLTATGQVVWDRVDGATLATVFPALRGMGGQYSGTITLEPARDPRPLEPVRLDVNVAATDGHFRSMNIGGKGLLAVHAVGYLNTDRAVLDHSDIYLAGGVMHIWARAGYRPGARLATQAAIDFDHFQLDQIAHVDRKIDKPMPGLLSGQIGLIRSGPHSSQVLGQAKVLLTQTDLGNFGPIASLYSLMHVGGGPSSGTGTVTLGFEQNTLRITDFRYFNQGVEARGLCSLGPIDYSNLAKTRLDGQVVGTARPLANTRIPLLADFDSVFNAFQGSLTTINVLGTLEKPAYPPALVSDIGKTLRNLLVGEAEGSSNTQ